MELFASGTGHGNPPRHSIHTQGRSVIVLSIDVEYHAGIHNHLFLCIETPISQIKIYRLSTPQQTVNFIMGVMVVVG